MADYKSMSYSLLRAQLKAINALEKAHIDTETLFMQSNEPLLLLEEKEHQENK